jgi:hypothetical protein
MREVWTYLRRQAPTEGPAAFGATVEASYYFASRAHDRWRRTLASEPLAGPSAWLRVAAGYDPESALVTASAGIHASIEGGAIVFNDGGLGAYARYDRAGRDDRATSDLEVGVQFAMWSEGRRTYLNEKVGYRHIDAASGTAGIPSGGFLQLRHTLVYVPSEDWGFTYMQEASANVGIGSEPHTNGLRVENTFLAAPSLLYSIGPLVGVDLDYFVGPARSALSVPVGGVAEVHLEPIALSLAAIYDVPTMQGQRTGGLLLRAAAGYRF